MLYHVLRLGALHAVTVRAGIRLLLLLRRSLRHRRLELPYDAAAAHSSSSAPAPLVFNGPRACCTVRVTALQADEELFLVAMQHQIAEHKVRLHRCCRSCFDRPLYVFRGKASCLKTPGATSPSRPSPTSSTPSSSVCFKVPYNRLTSHGARHACLNVTSRHPTKGRGTRPD
jgi:hypothetical protein